MVPTISIIIPVYKVEAYLSKCLDTILAQNYNDFEVILVDDGSPDNSGAICDKYAGEDNRVKVIHQTNAGVGVARNNGIDNAKGEWIMFVDSDDYIDQGMLQTGIEAIRNNPDAEAVLFYNSMDNAETGKHELIDRIFSTSRSATSRELFEASDSFERACSIYSKLYRKDIIDKYCIRYAQTPVYEDVLFNMKFFSYAKNSYYSDTCFYHYMIYPSVPSLTRSEKKIEDILVTLKEYLSVETALFENVSFSNEEKFNIRKRFFLVARCAIKYLYKYNLPKAERVRMLDEFIPQFRKLELNGGLKWRYKKFLLTNNILSTSVKDSLFSKILHY